MPLIRETIVVTADSAGVPHIAPLGLIADGEHWIIAPFRPSTTLDNLRVVDLDETTRKEILFQVCRYTDFRSLVRALISGPKKSSDRRTYVHHDGRTGDVYITVMGTPGQQTAALNALKHSAGLMRSKLTKALTLRQAPFLKFHFDENLKKELAIMDLLHKVALENAELDEKRAAANSGADSNQTEVTDAAQAADTTERFENN